MKCAFTGHRQMDENLNEELFMRALERLVADCGADTFYCGMARGFDLFAAQKIIALKKRYALRLVACIPFGGQIDTMKGRDRELYEETLENCDEVVVLSAEYYPGCMYLRNRYMVDNADVVIAHFNGAKGGTMYTLSYAKKNKKSIIII